ncbi:hypothetical protein A7982_13969 [Minicystis rosea]|nr:hypothetical protein A7982_13969 [Minicystis rosea]
MVVHPERGGGDPFARPFFLRAGVRFEGNRSERWPIGAWTPRRRACCSAGACEMPVPTVSA